MKRTNEELAEIFEGVEKQILEKIYSPDTTEQWTLTSKKKKVNTSTLKFDVVTTWKDNITVDNEDCVLVTQRFAALGKTCILNMASHYKPGGGVRGGARAQEEEICRRSNLIAGLEYEPNNKLYPIQEDEFIYTKDVTFFKDSNYNDIPEFKADVITIPAINLNQEKSHFARTKDELYDGFMKAKINSILLQPTINKCSNLVLSAFGCGVFKNDPAYVAGVFKKYLVDNNMALLYDNVSFAILNDSNSVANNFEIFSNTFKN